MILAVSGCGPSAMSPTSEGPPAPVSSSAVSAASVDAAGTAGTTVEDRPVDRIITMTTADGKRSAIVHHPTSARAGAPLVVVLHPAGVNAQSAQDAFGWDAVADRGGSIVLYPDGLLDLFQNTWNGGRCCPPATQLHTDDVGFLDDTVAAVRRYDGVGTDVYAVGFSNGAIMAYAWACARPGRLVGIGVVAGALMTDCDSPAPISVVAVHGDADEKIPMSGGPAPDGQSFPDVEASTTPFRRADGCAPEPEVTAGPGADVRRWNCAGGTAVVLDVVHGRDHAWPGAGPSAGSSPDPLDATGFLAAELLGAP